MEIGLEDGVVSKEFWCVERERFWVTVEFRLSVLDSPFLSMSESLLSFTSIPIMEKTSLRRLPDIPSTVFLISLSSYRSRRSLWVEGLPVPRVADECRLSEEEISFWLWLRGNTLGWEEALSVTTPLTRAFRGGAPVLPFLVFYPTRLSAECFTPHRF